MLLQMYPNSQVHYVGRRSDLTVLKCNASKVSPRQVCNCISNALLARLSLLKALVVIKILATLLMHLRRLPTIRMHSGCPVFNR